MNALPVTINSLNLIIVVLIGLVLISEVIQVGGLRLATKQ